MPTSDSIMGNISVCIPLGNRQVYWYNFFKGNLTKDEKDTIIQKEKEKIRKELLVDTKVLTSYISKKRVPTTIDTAPRQSAELGVAFLVTLMVLIVLVDILSCFE